MALTVSSVAISTSSIQPSIHCVAALCSQRSRQKLPRAVSGCAPSRRSSNPRRASAVRCKQRLPRFQTSHKTPALRVSDKSREARTLREWPMFLTSAKRQPFRTSEKAGKSRTLDKGPAPCCWCPEGTPSGGFRSSETFFRWMRQGCFGRGTG